MTTQFFLGRIRKALFRYLMAACAVMASPACTYEPASPAASREKDAVPVAAPSPSAASTTGVNARLSFEPDRFESCIPPRPQQAMIRWDATESGASNVNIVILGVDGSEGMFASGGVKGEKISGDWMTPGIVIAVRDAATGKELARTTAGSLLCPR